MAKPKTNAVLVDKSHEIFLIMCSITSLLRLVDDYLIRLHKLIITSAKEVIFSSLFVCLSVDIFAQKLPNGFA